MSTTSNETYDLNCKCERSKRCAFLCGLCLRCLKKASRVAVCSECRTWMATGKR